MRIFKHSLQTLAVGLAFLLVLQTIPLSAAEVSSRSASIGQVSAVGAVDLRGVRIAGDGTMFSGDRMNVGSGGYAKVSLGAGPKIEVAANSDVTVTREDSNVQVRMASGNVAFKGDGKAPIRMMVGPWEVTAPGNSSGNVAYIGKDTFGVRVLTGSVGVRNTATKESFSVQKGADRVISLQTGTVSPTFQKIASTSPAAVPALPQPRQGSSGLSKGGWIAVIGVVAGAGAAIAVLTTRNDDTDSKAAARLAQVKDIQNLAAVKSTATAAAAAAAQVTTTATAAQVAINASSGPNKAALQASANATIAKASSAATKVANLTSLVDTLQNEASSQEGGLTSQQEAQLNQLLADLEIARKEANDAINLLNDLLSQAQANNVGGLPSNPNLQNVGGPNVSSASAPQ